MTPRVDEVCYRDAYARTSSRACSRLASYGPPLIVLESTALYPGGGGQPSDRGTILRAADGRTWVVRAARRMGGEIVHELERPMTASCRERATGSRSMSSGRADTR